MHPRRCVPTYKCQWCFKSNKTKNSLLSKLFKTVTITYKNISILFAFVCLLFCSLTNKKEFKLLLKISNKKCSQILKKQRIRIDHIVEAGFVVHYPVNKIVTVVVVVACCLFVLLLVLMVTLSFAMVSVTTIRINCKREINMHVLFV